MSEDRRDRGDEEHHHHEQHDGAKRERECLAALLHEALRSGLVAGDVDPGDQRSHATRRAPQGKRDRDQERDRNARATGTANRRDLLLDKLLHLVGERLPEAADCK